MVRALVLASMVMIAVGGCDRDSPLERLGEIEARRDADAPFLRASLAGASGGVRARAARAAGRIQAASLIDPLVPLLADPDPTVRIEAAFALGQIAVGRPDRRPRIAAHLVSALGRVVPNPEPVVAEMIRALGKTRARPHRGFLRRYLLDPRPAVAGAAMLAFAEMGVPLSAGHYRAMLSRSRPTLRWQGLYLASRRAPPELRVELASEALGDTSAVVRAMAARALRGCSGAAVHRLLGDHLAAGEPEESVQIAAIETLSRVRDRDALSYAAGYLYSPWPEVRAIAARAAARDSLVAEEALPAVLLVSNGRDARVRAAAAPALAVVSHPDAAARFVALASDSSAVVRAGAVAALPRWARAGHGHDARRLVEGALADRSAAVRRAALAALVELDPAAARAEADRRLSSGNDLSVVIGAVEAMVTLAARTGEPERSRTVERLVELHSPACRPQVTAALLRGVTALTVNDACPLLPFMTDPWPGIRAMAYETARDRAADPMWCVPHSPSRVYDVGMRTWPVRPYPDADELPNRAELVTDRGSVVMRLHGRDAPMTVAHLLRLVEQGRLVDVPVFLASPDSLVGFGCPRGDGYGDESVIVPPEITMLPVVGGAVALAIDEATGAGDVRILVALRPIPEIEGRHAVFGTIVSGLDRMRRMQPGERVRAVRID